MLICVTCLVFLCIYFRAYIVSFGTGINQLWWGVTKLYRVASKNGGLARLLYRLIKKNEGAVSYAYLI
jgi:hypothetical protein